MLVRKSRVAAFEARIEVKPSYGLGDQEITRMLQESFDHAKTDFGLAQTTGTAG